ncbi:hypothetical protein [Anaeromyxobacter diazotrophicus]|uniref:Uncharacterized protein n=1 Tax=Anaeromyxobacter diazotrophicus TaxID=2590199 RepID=A0A7I9VKE2_9BACT|nr:hypothetical protein [Anaeromyxobacter diazotrophicus]GEJ56589.1 hypothetical protein AMYX_13300 [Anaeromyxobacter diazotrophicus]
MSLEHSLTAIMQRLADWSGFPKYQLERRIDIFLTPFLEAFVGAQLGGTAKLLAPEFPLLASLRPSKKCQVPVQPALPEEKRRALTVNVDYLLRLDRATGGPAWVFLELKTDARSFDGDQAALYLVARERGMGRLLEDLQYVSSRPSAPKAKYATLKASLPAPDQASPPILVAYLGPSSLAASAMRWKDEAGRALDHFLTLSGFAAMPEARVDPADRELWPLVAKLLRSIDRGEVEAGRT